jgi:uncharacterized membrane protein
MHINVITLFTLKMRLRRLRFFKSPRKAVDVRDDPMDASIERLPVFETTTSGWIHLVGIWIEVFGVFIIVAGIVGSTLLCVHWRQRTRPYDEYKIRIGRSLLLGLEVLVAADIVKTIAIELTFTSLGLLAGLVIVRTFLSWTLVLEIEGRWPWSHAVPTENAVRQENNAIP